MKIYVIDDDVMIGSMLKPKIQKILPSLTDLYCESIDFINKDFAKCIKTIDSEKNINNIYIIDIELKSDINGFEIANMIRQFDIHGYIIFLTSHLECMPYSFLNHLKAFEYIIKSDIYYSKRLESALLQINEETKILKSQNCITSKKIESTEYFEYAYKGRLVKIPLNEIISIVTDICKRGSVIKTFNEAYKTSHSLKFILSHLPDENFIQCHRMAIINKNHIVELTINKNDYKAKLINNESLPISKSKVKIIVECFKEKVLAN